MSPQDRQALSNAICREDLLSFVRLCMKELLGGATMEDNWHLELVAAELQAAASGHPGATRRLILNLPPRHLKSMISSVALSAWLLGRDPTAQILCVSYGQDLAATFGRQALQIMSSTWYAILFPKTKLRASNQSAFDFSTTAGGFRKATSVGGVLTGRGGSVIIIDDPLKAEDAYSEAARNQLEEWFGRTLVSRLNNKQTGVIIVVMQRLHADDLSGSLLRKGGWRHIRLPAIADDDERFEITTGQKTRHVGRMRGEALHAAREPLEVLHELKQTQGESVFAAQYQQNPLPASGNIVKTRWLQYYTLGDGVPKFDEVFQSWDTAIKPSDDCDYSVCTTWGTSARRLYLLDVFRERLDFPDLCRAVVALKEKYGAATVLIEDKASGTQVFQELRSRSLYWVKGVEPHGDKITRMQGQTVLIENGGVVLPKGLPWVSEYVRELTAFPHGKYDDQVDSTSQALAWFNPRVVEPSIITFYREKLERKARERGKQSPAPS
jgi:predicted phage terminase large subunit-like protein